MTAREDDSFSVFEASVAVTRAALEDGRATAVSLLHSFLGRIGAWDRQGTRLNAVPVLNPDLFREAAESDARRARGETLGPLDGIPYTAKDSYSARGMTVAAGSPAFAELIAGEDAFVIERLRAAGAILVGLTNMPPMAAGGMQRGLYGRAESPYNPYFMSSAYGSGSSNGSGTATTAGFAVFGLGEETWSSGRAPASNSSLVAYTPSRGVISMRGNWPLYPTMDVAVPHTRTVADLLEVLDVIVADDDRTRGDFWRAQPWVKLPEASALRPPSYPALAAGAPGEGAAAKEPLAGRRLGVPRMYINRDPDSENPIATRPAVIALWERARAALEELGAEVAECDFPAVSNYEEDRPGARSMYSRGIVPEGFIHTEMWDLAAWAWNDFLDRNGDESIRSLDDVDGERIFPLPPGAIPDHYEDDPDLADVAGFARGRQFELEQLPHLEAAVRGLEEVRRTDLEAWLEQEELDGLVFPAAADVAPFDADFNPRSNQRAWRNGTVYSNGNLVIRHLGIPTVTVPMGVTGDIGMPVGLTFAGPAWADTDLMVVAAAFERARPARVPPPRTPGLASDRPWPAAAGRSERAAGDAPFTIDLEAGVSPVGDTGTVTISIRVGPGDEPPAGGSLTEVGVLIDGRSVDMRPAAGADRDPVWTGSVTLAAETHYAFHSHWRPPYGSLVSAIARDADGRLAGAFTTVGGI